jgi:hypothetical protein
VAEPPALPLRRGGRCRARRRHRRPSARPARPARHPRPHLWLDWLDHDRGRVGLHDLVDTGLLLLTDATGTAWTGAAKLVAGELSLPLRALRVGVAARQARPGRCRAAWAARYGLQAGGAVLIRPDGYVAWPGPADTDPAGQLRDMLRRILAPPARRAQVVGRSNQAW